MPDEPVIVSHSKYIAALEEGDTYWTRVAVPVDDKVVPLEDYLRDMEARIIKAIKEGT